MDLHDETLDTAKVHQHQLAEHESNAKNPVVDHHLLQLQRLAGNSAVAQLMQEDDGEMVRRTVGGGGGPIEPVLRARMEAAMGQDFSDVRLHTGGAAALSAQRLGANAYTVGNDVVFGHGRYSPDSASGQRTLAHELTHVVQQRSGPVEGSDTGTGVKVSDPGDRFERAAEANADRVMAGLQSNGAIEPIQGMAIQREAEAEEEELPS